MQDYRKITKEEIEKFTRTKKWQKAKQRLDKDMPELLVMLTKCASCGEIFPIPVIDNHETACMNQLTLWKNFVVWHLYGTHCTTHQYQCLNCTKKGDDYPFYSEDELDNGKCPECGSENIVDVDTDCEEWLVTHDNDPYIIWNGHNYKPTEDTLKELKRMITS